MKLRGVAMLSAALAALFGGAIASAQGTNQNNTNLPPAGVYLSPSDVHAMYSGPGLAIVLTAIQHQPFADGGPVQVQRTPANGGVDEIEEFGSSIMGMVSINGGAAQPVAGSGPVSTIVHGHGPLGSPTGTFQTEMLSMDLNFGGGVMIRESPTLPSLGVTSITDIGGGMYHIDSFFDVFTELSLDGGTSWIPSDGPTHVSLTPEPSSLAMLAVAMVGLGGCAWRRRRRVA